MINNKKKALKETTKSIIEILGIIFLSLMAVFLLVVAFWHNSKYVDDSLQWIFPISLLGSIVLFLIITFIFSMIKFDYEHNQIWQIIEEIENEFFIETNKNISIDDLHFDDRKEILKAKTDEQIVNIKHRIKEEIKIYIDEKNSKYVFASYKK